MKFLFVAMSESIHTARWINQVTDCGWDVHLFPVTDPWVHPKLSNAVFHPPYRKSGNRDRQCPPSVDIATNPLMLHEFWKKGRKWFPKRFEESQRLANLIKKLKPDIVHSLEIQHAGYLTLDAKRRFGAQFPDEPFPKWIVTNWGSDIYLFNRLREHHDRIREVLKNCDYYDCECERDIDVARELGFTGPTLPVVPNSGGIDLEYVATLRQPGPTSNRRLVVLKGYQHWAGRALTGIRALELCADVLQGYRVVIYKANSDVKLAAELLAQSTGIQVDILPELSHDEMLKLHGSARTSIGLSISDGLSTSFIEALAMGSFPIQSSTAAADEWITHGEGGMIVDPHDPSDVARAIRRAVTNDALVDRAAEINFVSSCSRLSYADIQRQVIQSYLDVHNNSLQTPRVTYAHCSKFADVA